mgnify:CR=1 FL=1
MAVRSGAGTGVTVALVVCVLTTAFFIAMTIVFYAGRSDALQAKQDAEQALADYVTDQQRNRDQFKAYESKASQQRQSVAGYINDQYQSTLDFVDPGVNSLDQLKQKTQAMGVSANQPLMRAFQDARSSLRRANGEIDGLQEQIQSWEDKNAELRAQMDDLKEAHRNELDSVQEQIAGYRQAAEEYRKEVQDTRDMMESTVKQQRQRYEDRIEDLESEIDSLHEERVVLRARIDDLENKISEERMKGKDPALLVDGRVIDFAGAEDEVYIDKGRRQRIVLGMTFEVYDSEAALSQVTQDSQLPRGKASLQVVKVGETTSTCKVTRSVPGRPVVRGDVLANAVYDPDYKFKFLVHGKYDTNGDGRPTEAEAEFLRSVVVDWGGTVVTGDKIPGDLDFLVLGVEPPMPSPPPPDAPSQVVRDYARKREIVENYNRLFRQAREAQIPVLNANRFKILTGYTER